MKTFWTILKWIGIVFAILVILSLIIPPGYKVISGVWNWGFGTEQEAEVVTSDCPDCICPQCPDLVCLSAPEDVESEISTKTPEVRCKADIVGIPVDSAGSCTFCTINYQYDPQGVNPGDVYIVESNPMEYEAGAYVYQYLFPEDFEKCIEGQVFYTDPGYNPIWVDRN
jgi:hypothetical protein